MPADPAPTPPAWLNRTRLVRAGRDRSGGESPGPSRPGVDTGRRRPRRRRCRAGSGARARGHRAGPCGDSARRRPVDGQRSRSNASGSPGESAPSRARARPRRARPHTHGRQKRAGTAFRRPGETGGRHDAGDRPARPDRRRGGQPPLPDPTRETRQNCRGARRFRQESQSPPRSRGGLPPVPPAPFRQPHSPGSQTGG